MNGIRSDEDESENEDFTAETLEESTDDSSSSEKGASTAVLSECDDIDVDTRKGANVLLNIHDQLDLNKLQKVSYTVLLLLSILLKVWFTIVCV